jgi:pilus assembly protein Flp/PilA
MKTSTDRVRKRNSRIDEILKDYGWLGASELLTAIQDGNIVPQMVPETVVRKRKPKKPNQNGEEVIPMLNAMKEKGQGMVEYALILVLVAVVVIAALTIMGPLVANVFSTINASLSVPPAQ